MPQKKAYVFQDFSGVYLFDQSINLIYSNQWDQGRESISNKLQTGLTESRFEEIKQEHDLDDFILKSSENLSFQQLSQVIEQISTEREKSQENNLEKAKLIARKYDERKIEQSKSEDKVLVQATKAKEELDEMTEVFSNRIDGLSSFVESLKGKENNPEKALESFKSDLKGSEVLKSILEEYKNISELKEEMENYIEQSCDRIAHNLKGLLGAKVASKIIAHAGSLEKLAKMPSSTIQVLGAEKALFRYLKGDSSPPKHGILFLHPYVNQTPEDKRGKIARFMANKAAIAARLDYYNGDYKGDKLHEEVKEKYDSLNS